MKRNTNILRLIFFIGTLIYLVLTLVYAFKRPIGGGDESLFIADLELINNKGWVEAIKKNISIPYMILVYPFSLFFKKYVALRIVNVLITGFLILYFYKKYDGKISLLAYLFFYFSTTIFFFFGTNDALFNSALIIFFNEVFLLSKNKKFSSDLAFSALIIAMFTRFLYVVYLPAIIISFIVIYNKRDKFIFRYKYSALVFVLLLALNIPSLIEKGTISYDLKSPPKTIKASWSQRQYLAQLMVNKGELRNQSHPTWKYTDDYITTHGKEALPDGILNGIFFDLRLTFKEFFKDLVSTSFYASRQLGLIFVFILIIPFIDLIKNKKLGFDIFLPITFFLMFVIFCFIIISYVELRWLAPTFVMGFVWFYFYEAQNNLNKKLVLANSLTFILLLVYGVFRLIMKKFV